MCSLFFVQGTLHSLHGRDDRLSKRIQKNEFDNQMEPSMPYAAQRLTLGPLLISTLALGLYGIGLTLQITGQYLL